VSKPAIADTLGVDVAALQVVLATHAVKPALPISDADSHLA